MPSWEEVPSPQRADVALTVDPELKKLDMVQLEQAVRHFAVSSNLDDQPIPAEDTNLDFPFIVK